MSEILRASFPFSCPACGARVRTTLGAIQSARTVTCPAGHQIQLQEEGSGIGRVDRALDDFKRSIKRLNRQLR